MLQINTSKKKYIVIATLICLALIFQPLVNISATSAQSMPDTSADRPTDTSENHTSNNSVSNRSNSRQTNSPTESTNQSNDSFFNPPRKGAPKRTADAGARGPCPVYGAAQPVTLLIPNYRSSDRTITIAASTVSDYPTLLWYVPSVVGLNYLGLTLIEEETAQIIYQTTIPVAQKPGIMRWELPSSEPPLKVGQWYEWVLSVSSSENAETILNSACYANGYIGRRPLNISQQEELDNAGSDLGKLWDFYAKEVIWYDGLATLDRMRRENLANENINQKWQALLELSGLAELSGYPPVDINQPSAQTRSGSAD